MTTQRQRPPHPAPRIPSAGSGGPTGRRAGRLRPFRTLVRGHAFAAVPPDHGGLTPGTAARAVREPDNPADPLAVAIWAEPRERADVPWRIGYLDRVVAARLAPRLDRGARVEVEVEGLVPEPDGRWLRPVVRLCLDDSPPGRPGPGRAEPAGLWGRPPGVTLRRLGG
jgi:hypothetical protein